MQQDPGYPGQTYRPNLSEKQGQAFEVYSYDSDGYTSYQDFRVGTTGSC